MKNLVVLLLGLFTLAACSTEKTESSAPPSSGVEQTEKVDSNTESKRMIAVHADYCSVCSKMKPLVRKIKSRCESRGIAVEIIDLTEENEGRVVEDLHVAALPTYIFLDAKNREVARLIGAQSEETLVQALSVLSGEDCKGLGRIVSYDNKKEVDEESCRSTNTNAKIAAKNSKLSEKRVTKTKSDAQSAIKSQRSCSPVSL